ncbi:MAG: dTDP-4-dehydrorhamnose reductase [Bacillota bacterium]
MKVAVIGAGGQLGSDLVRVMSDLDCIPLMHNDIEVTDEASCIAVLTRIRPDVVINTAAFHQVDACEDDPNRAWTVNALGSRNVVKACEATGATYVYISTDFVFDGEKGAPYVEEDVPRPINTYGVTKLAGEFYARCVPNHYVVRVASLFGVAGASGKGGNFVETMIRKARSGERVAVVADLYMSPTYTRDAAVAIKYIIESRLPAGVYHVTGHGTCSWLEFAEEILRQAGFGIHVAPLTAADLRQKAKRPRFSALLSSRLPSHVRRPWQEALGDYLREKGHIGS